MFSSSTTTTATTTLSLLVFLWKLQSAAMIIVVGFARVDAHVCFLLDNTACTV